MNRRHVLGLAAAGLAAPGILRAQGAWPERPIRLIVPFPPGGSTDVIARIFQPRLSEVLGRAVVIENRGGAAGSIGAVEAARSAPDGYTWLLAFDNEATNQTVLRLPYRTLTDFAPVTLVAQGPLALVTHPATPFRSFPDLLAAARQRPDHYAFATSGAGGLAHVSTTLLTQRAGIRLIHVPYRGGAPALQDAVAGVVPLFMSNVVIISQHIAAGTLRPLGVTTREETRHVAGVRSFAQQGVADFEAQTWWALLGRAGTPQPILDRMHQALTGVLNEPAVRQRIEAQGCDVVAGTPEHARQFLAAEIERWGAVIRAHNITAES